jgi:predicted nucleic acid-binding protein
MNYLLDTNIVSETIRATPNQKVIQWLRQIPNESLYISVLTIGEIRKGVELAPDQKRKEKLQIWLEVELPRWFEDRILTIDLLVSERWGRLQAKMKSQLPVIDSLLAATALHHDMRLVTRNVDDFNIAGLDVINPFIT